MAVKAILKELQSLIKQLTIVQQEPKNAYQFVREYYGNYIRSLHDISKNKVVQDVTGPVITVLRIGMNRSPMWKKSSQCMDHFGLLSRTLRGAINKLS